MASVKICAKAIASYDAIKAGDQAKGLDAAFQKTAFFALKDAGYPLTREELRILAAHWATVYINASADATLMNSVGSTDLRLFEQERLLAQLNAQTSEDIGNIGTICCSDGEYPEAVRALTFNGAELVYRPSEAVPMTNVGASPGGSWMVQNRGHAEFNNVYMLCPNIGPVYLSASARHPIDISGGNGHVVGYRGEVLSHNASGANTVVSAVIDIELTTRSYLPSTRSAAVRLFNVMS